MQYVWHELQVLVIQEADLQLAYSIYPRDAHEVRVEAAREVATPRPVAFCLLLGKSIFQRVRGRGHYACRSFASALHTGRGRGRGDLAARGRAR